jgi:hypothetical protein
MAEQYPSSVEQREMLPQQAAMIGHEAIEGQLAAERAARVEASVHTAEEAFRQQGTVKEAYALRVGSEVTIPVMNFSERPLSPSAGSSIAAAMERFTWIAGPNNTDKLGMSIAVMPGKVAIEGTNVRANADKQTRVIRIAEDAFEEDLLPQQNREDYDQLVGNGHKLGEVELVHEASHIGEFAAIEHRTTESDPRIVKDFFADNANNLSFDPPYRSSAPQDISANTVTVFRDGEYTQMNGAEAYGENAIVHAPTAYARKSPGEYFADVATGYAYDSAVDQPLKDMVRATMDTQLPAGMAARGPVPQASFERIL